MADDAGRPVSPAPPETAGRRHLLLIGMMGSGKTTVAGRLAEALGWPWVDTDALVEAAAGRSVADIFAERGEAAFRALEADAVRTAVAPDEPRVVSVAGGAVLSAGNREVMRAGGLVVWLRARTDTLVARVGSGEGRPLLAGDPAAVLAGVHQSRRPVYEELADAVVDVDDISPDEVAERIMDALRLRTRA